VGSIFRTADAVGVSKIYLTGYTPAPTDKFGRANKDIAKTALGAEQTIPWEKAEEILTLIEKIKNESYQLIALEQSSSSIDYKKVELKKDAAVIVGNEVLGIDPEILKRCDVIAEIPMHGEKESLNVAVAAGIALFRWLE
jgi:tRNA G18 (ribose-2'-O)-methylase SpoU